MSNIGINLPEIEQNDDGSLYVMTTQQRNQAVKLIRRECCNCVGDECVIIEKEDRTYKCPQMLSYSVCCKWFRWAVLPLDSSLEKGVFGYSSVKMKKCNRCGRMLPSDLFNGRRCNYCEQELRERRHKYDTAD